MTRRVRALALVALLPAFLAACTAVENPATGQREFTSLTPEQAKRLGDEQHPKVLAEFGGEYDDPELQAYVDRIGEELVEVSELSDREFTFTVLDSPVVNAFALPGYVYVSRGLLALADNEAEVAGVIGHEIGHVTARHTAARYDRQLQGQFGATALQLGGAILGGLFGGQAGADLGGQLAGQAGGLAATAYVQGFSRQQEFEADQLGIRYLDRAGYSPYAMASFLEALEANRQLQAGADAGSVPNGLSSHPRTPDRIVQAAQEAGGEPLAPGEGGRDRFLDAIDGMVYGENPAQGFVRGQTFLHPELGFRFEAPDGFQLTNTPAAVIGRDRQGRAMIFDMGRSQATDDPARYLEREWTEEARVDDLERVRIDGQDAAVGFTSVRANDQPAQALLAAIDAGGGRFWRFVYVSRDLSGDLRDFERSLQSFETLSAQEAARVPTRRIEIVEVGRGDTVEDFAARMQVDELPRETFEVLNDLQPGDSLQAGQRVKIVVETSSRLRI